MLRISGPIEKSTSSALVSHSTADGLSATMLSSATLGCLSAALSTSWLLATVIWVFWREEKSRPGSWTCLLRM